MIFINLRSIACLVLFSVTVSSSLKGAECFSDPKTKIDHKVIVTVNGGAKVYDAPQGKQTGKLIMEMDIRFVMKPSDKEDDPANKKNHALVDGKKWYRISPDGEVPEGWVSEAEVSLWVTRSVLKPSGIVGGKFVVKRKSGGPDIIYDGTAPDNYLLLAPILKPRDESNEDNPFDVLVFGANTQGTVFDVTSNQPKESMAYKDAKLEIVFVVDTTASMQYQLDGVKEVVNQIVIKIGESGNAESLNKKVRFALVAYQDSTPGLTPSQVSIQMTDAKDFASKIKNTTVAKQGSDEWQEDVIAGLKLAVDRKDGSFIGNIGWSQNSSKQIILCGDASALKVNNPKSTTKKTIEQILEVGLPSSIEPAAQARSQIKFHAILALNKDGEGDWQESRKDFQEVAANLEKEQGIFTEMTANDSASREKVASLFNEEFKNALLALSGGTPSSAAAKSSTIARGIYRLRDGKPLEGVALGTANEFDENDQPVAKRAWMMRYTEVQSLKSRLRFLHDSFNNLSETQRKSSKSMLSGLAVTFAIAGVGEPVLSTELSEVVDGMPLKNDVLKMTIDDIRKMDDKTFERWKDLLMGSERRCEELLNIKRGGTGVNEWLVLGEEANANKTNLVTFISIDQLP